MRTLIYVPVIHTSADLGSLAKEVKRRGIAGLGKELWEEHRRTVESFWDVITEYFKSVDVSGAKIYQDGMVADGEVGAEIVGEGVKSGSRNYKLVSTLLKRGATLVRTEDFNLVRQERDRLVAITQCKSTTKRLVAFLRYKLVKDKLLKKRDKFIAAGIDKTLHHGENGILFIGAFHNVKGRLPKSIQIKEIKDTEKVKEYQRLLPFYDKYKGRFDELGRYLTSKIEI